MFGIDAEKFFVLLIIGALVIGPTKLPEYAAKLGQLVREVRRMANGAQQQLKEELGPDFDDVDWRRLDPRQYDPRRIIRDALTEQEPPASGGSTPDPAAAVSLQPATPALRLAPGTAAPYDTEAT